MASDERLKLSSKLLVYDIYVTHKICTFAMCCTAQFRVICRHAFRLFVEKLYSSLIPDMIYSLKLVCCDCAQSPAPFAAVDRTTQSKKNLSVGWPLRYRMLVQSKMHVHT